MTPLIGLGAHMSDVAEQLLGKPNSKLSSRHELRFGRKGSLSINVKSGVWFDHESSEGGGVLALVKRGTGDDQNRIDAASHCTDPRPKRGRKHRPKKDLPDQVPLLSQRNGPALVSSDTSLPLAGSTRQSSPTTPSRPSERKPTSTTNPLDSSLASQPNRADPARTGPGHPRR
jgi:hypothetical protein